VPQCHKKVPVGIVAPEKIGVLWLERCTSDYLSMIRLFLRGELAMGCESSACKIVPCVACLGGWSLEPMPGQVQNLKAKFCGCRASILCVFVVV